MTRRLIESIEEQSLSKTFVEVAENVGVDEKTVRIPHGLTAITMNEK